MCVDGRNASFGQLFFAVRNEGAKVRNTRCRRRARFSRLAEEYLSLLPAQCVTFKSFKKKQTLKLDTQHQVIQPHGGSKNPAKRAFGRRNYAPKRVLLFPVDFFPTSYFFNIC